MAQGGGRPRQRGERVQLWARAGRGGRFAHLTGEEIEAKRGELHKPASWSGHAGMWSCPSVPTALGEPWGPPPPTLRCCLFRPRDVAMPSAMASSVGAEEGAGPQAVPGLRGLDGFDALVHCWREKLIRREPLNSAYPSPPNARFLGPIP